MKYDLISQIKDYLKRNVAAGKIFNKDGSRVDIFDALQSESTPLDEVFYKALNNGESGRSKLPFCLEKVLEDINECGYPELNAIKLYENIGSNHRNSYSINENTNYLKFSCIDEANRAREARLTIDEDKLYMKVHNDNLTLTYSRQNDGSFRLSRLTFRIDADYVICEIEDPKNRNGKISIYANLDSYYYGDPAIPEDLIPDITCNFVSMSSGKGFIVRDKNDAIGDGEKLFVCDEQMSKNTAFIRRNDRESDLKLYRALSERVDEKYHEYCLFDKKSKVLTRKLEPVPQVKLEG